MNKLSTILLFIVIAAVSLPGCSSKKSSNSLSDESVLIEIEEEETEEEEEEEELKDDEFEKKKEHKGKYSTLRHILFYVPNRVFDVLDIFRARVRVGPGTGISFRITDYADLNLGTYATVYAGLPGPRQRVTVPLPVGLETYSAAELSLLEASADFGFGPDYSKSEVGFGLHALLVGLDLGIDPVEIVDLAAGIFLLDLREDDWE